MKPTDAQRATALAQIQDTIATTGAVCRTAGSTLDHNLAAVAWVSDPDGTPLLRWCPMWPTHQGHIHHTRYDTIAADGVYVNLSYRGQWVWGCGPAHEFGVDPNEYQDTRSRWLALLSDDVAAEGFADFFKHA
jgi:hypothetical protein